MKKQTMFLRMITASLVRRRSRMLVALLAIAVGATILSGLVTIYYDVPKQMGEQFRSYGANMLFTGSDGDKLTAGDIEQAVKAISSADLVGYAPYRYDSVLLNERPLMAAGTDFAGVQKTSPYWMVDGAWPEKNGEALVGKETAASYGLKVGKSFKLFYDDGSAATADEAKPSEDEMRSMDFTVAGILDTGGKEESYIFLTTGDLEELTGIADSYDVCELSVSAPQEMLEKYADSITAGGNVAARLVKRVTQSEDTVLSKLQALVFLVTAVVLLLTMICVATTMMAVVAERRKEVGLRKALGASNRSIVFEFMGEGLLLGAIGGLLGSVLGFLFAQLVSMNVFNSSITFHPLLIPVTVAVSVVVTGISCLLPVRSATDVDPALVLKGE